ncbi:hypothetical protein DEDE109153_14715 [Deinococcus deserti]
MTAGSRRLEAGSMDRSKYLCQISLSVDKSVDNLWISPLQPVDKSVDNLMLISPVDKWQSYPQVIHRNMPLIHNFVHRTNMLQDAL